MNGEAFRERVAEAKATELDRLGSEKLLIALTDADLETDRVLEAAAASERAARETFAGWAETEASGGDEGGQAAGVFAAIAEREDEHYERVIAHLGGSAPAADADGDAGGPLHAYLRNRESTVERAAGLVGRGLVADRTHLQVISFFVNEGDAELADCFRDLRAETEESTTRGLALLEDHCETERDWETAAAVAEYAIQLAYDDYADALEAVGLDPKPIC